MVRLTFILIIGLLSSNLALYGQKFQATISKGTVGVGERVRVEYKLDDNGDRFTPPSFDGFRILSGPNQSSSMQFVNGRSSHSLSYNYVLMAMEEGEVTLKPASIQVGSEVIYSNELKINIVAGSSPNAQQGSQNSNNSQKSQGQNSSKDIDDNIFIRASVSKTSPYVGEQMIATYKLYFNYNIVDNSFSTLPNLTGFWSEDLEIENSRRLTEVVNGVRYNVAILKKSILIPQRSGNLEIDPIEMELVIQQQVKSRSRNMFDQFFGSYKNVKVTVRSAPVKIAVKALPSGRPASFSGAVGQFKMDLSADRTEVKSNESVNITYTISGSGNLKLLDEPDISFPTDFEVYDPKTEDKISVSGNGMSGSRTYRYLTIPRHKGQFSIDPVPFTYFDPSSARYVTLTSNVIDFEIEKGQDESGNAISFSGTNKQDIKLIGSDIRFIKPQTVLLQSGYSFFGTFLYYFLWLLPIALFFIILFIKRKIDEKRGDAIYMKKTRANKMAVKRLSLAKKFQNEGDEKKFYEEIFKALYGLFADKFNINTSELSKDRIRETLENRKVSPELIQKTEESLNLCEMARFAPSSNVSTESFYESTVDLVSKLQKELK